MTIFDAQNLFSRREPFPSLSRPSENVIDLLARRDIAPGHPLMINIRVVEDPTPSASPFLFVEVQQSDTTAFIGPTLLGQSGQIPVSRLVTGYQFALVVTPRTDERYLRLYYNAAGGTFSGGGLMAGLVLDVQDSFAYEGVVG